MLIVRAGGARHVVRARVTRPASMPPKCPPVMHSDAAADVPPVAGERAASARIARIAAPAPPCRCRPRPTRIAVGPRVREAARRARATSLDRQAADRRGALDRPLGQARLELGPALACGARASRGRRRPASSDDPHEAERERRVGARARREVLVAALGGVGAQRVDRDDVRAAPLRRQHEPPLVEVRREQVGAPQHDQPGVLEVLGVHAHRAAVGGAQRGAGRGRADRRLAAARRRAPRTGAAPMIQPCTRPIGAGEVVGQDRLGAVPRRSPSAGRRRSPSSASSQPMLLEAALALRADAAQRVQEPVGAVQRVEVAVDLARRARRA